MQAYGLPATMKCLLSRRNDGEKDKEDVRGQ
jgi:hypothetical protein